MRCKLLLYRDDTVKCHVDAGKIVVSWWVDGCWIIKKFIPYTPEIATELVEFVRNH